ncbi:MAG: hypothetical protein PHQ11_06645 [Paludibacter sp.]|nr:hypothetical protein [Paludibacter sp.]MDD4428111.1 hypothetical protein [Paludibacter sp.]
MHHAGSVQVTGGYFNLDNGMARIACYKNNPIFAGKVVAFKIFKAFVAHVVVDGWCFRPVRFLKPDRSEVVNENQIW